MLRFTLFGIPIVVQPFFWLTLAIIGALNNGSPMQDNSPYAMLHIALFVLAGFISILIHELGHALTAIKFGARCQIVLQAFGGYARYTNVGISRAQSICITAAGPVLQVLLGFAIVLIARVLPPMHELIIYFLRTLIVISWFWAIFNLLPIIPLDGGRIVESALGPQRIRITLWVSIITAAIIGLIAIAFQQVYVAIFIGMMGWQTWKALQNVPRWR